MAKTLSHRPLWRAGIWAGSAILLVLLARPLWQPGFPPKAGFVCLGAMPAGYAVACAFWLGRLRLRILLGCALLGAAWCSALMPAGFEMSGIALIAVAFPVLAGLRRATPGIVDEARLAGASYVRLATGPILKLAASGICYGALLVMAAPPSWRQLIPVAAALPFCIARRN